MYQKSSYKDSRGRSKTLYIMNRDGFTLLAMGFTGQEALIWKLRYIQAFNLMEQNLLQHQSPVWKDTRAYQKAIRRQETDTIKLFVEYAQSQGSAHSDQYYTQFSLLANKAVGITDRELATVQQLNILAMVENMIARRIEELITENMPYKAIYQDCKDYIAGFPAVGKPAVFILSQEIDYNRTTVQRRTDHKNNTKSNSAETHLKKHRKAGKNNEIYEQPLWSVKNF